VVSGGVTDREGFRQGTRMLSKGFGIRLPGTAGELQIIASPLRERTD
jgi:hypothetical protein